MHTLYIAVSSGNCWKPMMVMNRLGIDYQLEKLDQMGGEIQGDAFRAVNPNAKVPALRLDDGRLLSESNAMIWYLAETGPANSLVPADPFDRAQVLQWMFFEQYSHEPYVAVARFIMHVARTADQNPDKLTECHEKGHKALRLMNDHLETREFLVGKTLTLADIALYAYTHTAEEGGFDMSAYDAIDLWLDRVRTDEGYIEMLRA